MNIYPLDSQTIEWVLKNLKTLSKGEWPDSTQSYLERPLAKKTQGFHAPFENPAGLAGEVELRLERCGWDGLIVYGKYCNGIGNERFARAVKMSVEEIQKRINQALEYISSKNFWERKQTYKEFIYHRKGTQKGGLNEYY